MHLIELLQKDLDGVALDQTAPIAEPEEAQDPLVSYLDMRDQVAAAIDQYPKIAEIARFRQLSLASGKSSQLDRETLASALLRRTRALRNPEAAIAETLELFDRNEGYARVVMVLAGVQTAVPSEIAANIRLMPLGELRPAPPSWVKGILEDKTWYPENVEGPVVPSAALVMRVPFSPLFTTKPDSEDGTPDKELALLKTVVHCIELAAGPIASTKMMVWWEDDDCRFPVITDDTGVGLRDLSRPVNPSLPPTKINPALSVFYGCSVGRVALQSRHEGVRQ